MAAGDAVVIGTNAFTEQLPTRKWVRGRGWRKVRSFQGPKNDTLIDALTDELRLANAEEIDVAEGHPTVVSALVPSDSSSVGVGLEDEDATTEWTLEPYDLQKELGTHGVFNTSGAVPPLLPAIDNDLRQGIGYGINYTTKYGFDKLTEYARLKSQGVDSWMTFGYVLRAVLTCERENVFVRQWQQQRENIGSIISWSSIAVPNSALIEQPWVHIYVANAITETLSYRNGAPDEWSDVYFDQWMVKPAAIRFSKSGRVRTRQLVQEYLGAVMWSGTLYDGGAGAP